MAKLALATREPTGAVSAESARIKLQPLGTPLRAQARAHNDGRLVLEAELPWLQLGASCTAELSDGRNIDGTVHWIGLDMTRSGTARLRILVNTKSNQSIQLSVTDADVQELLPKAKKRPSFRWMLPVLVAVLAGGVGWAASQLQTPRPQLLAASPEKTSPRAAATAPVVKIPMEAPEVVMAPTIAPAAPAIAPALTVRKPVKKIVRKRR